MIQFSVTDLTLVAGVLVSLVFSLAAVTRGKQDKSTCERLHTVLESELRKLNHTNEQQTEHLTRQGEILARMDERLAGFEERYRQSSGANPLNAMVRASQAVGLCLLLLLAAALPCRAEQSCSQHHAQHGTMHVLTFEWTAAADGSLEEVKSLRPINGFIMMALTDPGTPAPTEAYDLTVSNPEGADLLGGALTDRSATGTQLAFPEGLVAVDGPVTIQLSGNSVDGATGTVKLYYYAD